MSNHVHHLLVPLQEDSLRWTLQITHKCFADHINAREGWQGHLWQQRFYSSPVDDDFFWVTLRYILRNPVEAGIVRHAVDYPWSSAAAHCHLINNPYITKDPRWLERLQERNHWHTWLAEPEAIDKLARLRNCTSRDLPTGSEEFLDRLEREYGITAHPPKLGRPSKMG